MAWEPPEVTSSNSNWQPPEVAASQSQGQPINATMESIAQPFRDIGNAVIPYAQQALSRPEVQPFQGINPFSKPQGGPVQQALGAAGQIASLPLRWSATLGQASGPVSEYVAENNQPGTMTNKVFSSLVSGPIFGQTKTVQNVVANPYASAMAGMVAGAAADPRSYVPASGLSAEHPNELPLKVAQSREARTGIPASQFQQLSRDPGALWAKGDISQVGEQLGKAKIKSDINLGVQHNDVGTLTPENIKMARSPRVVGKDALSSITDDLQAARELVPDATPEEHIALADIHPDTVNKALIDSNARLNKLIPGTDQYRAESAIKSNLQNVLQNVAPDVKAQNAAYARLKLRDAFKGYEPLNKNQTPSKLALIAKQVPKALGAAVGNALFGPAGAVGGWKAGEWAADLYHAPRIAGLQTAVGSVAGKPVNQLLLALEKMGTSPQAQALVARYLQQNGNQ